MTSRPTRFLRRWIVCVATSPTVRDELQRQVAGLLAAAARAHVELDEAALGVEGGVQG
jgi:hypothetical protein